MSAGGRTFFRYWRAVPADFTAPPEVVDVPYIRSLRGRNWTDMLERELRTRLSRDPRTPAVLVAPERATRAAIMPTGRVRQAVYAWAQVDDYTNRYLHAPHVLAELVATKYEPDEAEEFAERGAFVLHDARVTRLTLAPFLAPVAERWRRDFFFPVEVLDGPDVPAVEVPRRPPLVVPQHFDADACRDLWGCLMAPDAEASPRTAASEPFGVKAPAWALEMARTALEKLAAQEGLPLTRLSGWLLDYEAGARFRTHTDLDERVSATLDRTVSASILLNQPGRDFEGGDLVVEGTTLRVGMGDAVVYTARTPHAVAPVTAGHRFALAVHGEVER